MSTGCHLVLDGDHTVLSVLAAVADSAVIVCLVGESGAVIAWDNDPNVCRLDRHIPGSLTPHNDTPPCGRTWGTIPTDAFFVQTDYEFPAVAAQVIEPATRVTWDNNGQATLTVKRADDVAAIQELLNKNSKLNKQSSK